MDKKLDLPNDQLVDAVRCILDVAAQPLSEYQLIQQLNEQGWSLSTSAIDTLALYTTHFLVYSTLYHLQAEYWQENRFLEISALSIRVHEPAVDDVLSKTLVDYSNDQSLREYYLNSDNLNSATEASVNELLQQFWTRFVSSDDSSKAFEVLAIEPSATFSEVKQRYRMLAMEHHPDRGGSDEDFQAINWAFGVLQRFYR